jgi:hypothetical protein
VHRQEEPHAVAVVSACMTREGFPTFVWNEVAVTTEEQAEGVQYELVEKRLLADGLEEPFVHFPEEDSPAFLHPAVRALASASEPVPVIVFAQEDR